MSLPQYLSVSLKRFSDGICSTQRILADRSSFPSASVITLQLPRQGCIMLDSIALLADMFMQDASLTTVFNTPEYNSQMIRKVELSIGGTSVSLNSLNDYGFAYLLASKFGSIKARSDYEQSVQQEGKVALTAVSAGGVSTPLVLASRWLGFLAAKHFNVLPMDLLPECSLIISLHDKSRWTTADNSAIDVVELRNVRLLYKRIDFADNMLSKMWAAKLQASPIVLPFDNISYAESSATSATGNTFTTFINSQSVDLVAVGVRKGDYDTVYANRWISYSGNTTETVKHQVSFNNTPITTWGMVPLETVIETQASLGGSGNILYSPDVADYSEFKSTYFLQAHKLGTPVDAQEDKGFITGVPTYGQSFAVDYTISDADANSKKQFVMCFYKSTMELGAGKQVAIAP